MRAHSSPNIHSTALSEGGTRAVFREYVTQKQAARRVSCLLQTALETFRWALWIALPHAHSADAFPQVLLKQQKTAESVHGVSSVRP
jgi:hypothetical protein